MFYPVLLVARTLGTGANQAGDETSNSIANQVAGFLEFIISRIPAWIAGFIVFILAFFIARLAKSAVESRMESHVDEEHQDILILSGRITYYCTLVFGTFVALKIAGIDLTTLLAAIAFGIGFALRDLIMNFLSGVFILVSRQFVIGDFIKVGDTVGKVMEIQTRATILKGIDGTKVIVPNAEIFTSQVTSFTTNPLRRVTVPVFISYDTDISYAMKIALDVLKKHPKILKKPLPSIVLKEFGNSTIDLAARFWVGSRDGWFKVRSEIMQQMWNEFKAAGITVPYEIMHIETEQDTAEYVKETAIKAKKRMVEMGLSEQMAEENAPAPISAAAAISGAAPVPVPEAAYADQTEIDGQA